MMADPLCFSIVASADPQAVLRILGLFAQRHHVPRDMAARRVVDDMHIRIEMEGLDDGAADILCWKLRQIVCVKTAEWAVLTNVARLVAGAGAA